MSKGTTWALGVLAAWAVAAQAETLDEACTRLAAADAACRDSSSKWTVSFNMAAGPMTMKAALAADQQMLRAGDKRLMRMTSAGTFESSMAAIGKMDVSQLIVYDGQFLWTQMRTSKIPQTIVVKIDPAKGMQLPGQPAMGGVNPMGQGGFGLGGVGKSLKESLEELKQTATLRLLGPGNVAGRATTRIEVTLKPETLAKLPPQAQGMAPAKMVVDVDDQSGSPMALVGTTTAGQQIIQAQATQLQVNTGLDASLFRYSPPPGAMVQDMTGGFPRPQPQPAPQW